MQIGICTPFNAPSFPSSIPPDVKKAGKGKLLDLPWFSAGTLNSEAASGNGYFAPDLAAYKRLAERAAKILDKQGGPRIVQLDMEACPQAPGHDGTVVAPGTPMGPPTWKLWREHRDRFEYACNFFRPCVETVDKVIYASVYAALPVWFDGPPPKPEEERDYLTSQAVQARFLDGVGGLCVDVYPWPAADGNHLGLWDSDFDAKLRLMPAGKFAYPELYCFWAGSDDRVYVGDEMVRHMLDGCRRRGFEYVAVFEPPEQAWELLLEAVA